MSSASNTGLSDWIDPLGVSFHDLKLMTLRLRAGEWAKRFGHGALAAGASRSLLCVRAIYLVANMMAALSDW